MMKYILNNLIQK